LNIPLISSDDSVVIRKALVAGLFPHAAKRQQNGSYKVISTGLEVKIHPSSVLHGKAPDCIIFNEVVKTSRQYVRGVTVIEVSWLPEIAPAYFSRKSSG
jgi:ATP-dependent RNA helicase DHX8/PRP22